MRKLGKKQVKEVTEKLRPFWKRHIQLRKKFYKEEAKLEKEMTKKISPKIKLIFFYADGGCCGIGADKFEDRKKFPLINDTDLY